MLKPPAFRPQLRPPVSDFYRLNTPPLRLVLLLGLLWLCLGMVGHGPWKPDEPTQAAIVKQMLDSHDWLVPHLLGQQYTGSGPLYFWTAAGTARLFSAVFGLADGARLASVFYLGLMLLFTGLAGRELWGKGYGRLAVLLLIACLGLLIRSHQLVADTAFLAGLAISLYALARSLQRPAKAGPVLGIGLGISFLAQGLPELLMLLTLCLLLPVLFRRFRFRGYGLFLASALLVLLPWLLAWPYLLYQHSPAAFSHWLLSGNLVRLAAFAHPSQIRDPLYFVAVLPWFAWPAWPLAVWTLWQMLRSRLYNPAVQLCLAALAVILLFLTVTAAPQDTAAMVLLPPIALLAAGSVATLRRGASAALDWFGIMTYSLFALMLWVWWIALMTGHPTRMYARLQVLQPGITPDFHVLPFILAAALTLAWLIAIVMIRRSNLRAVTNQALGLTLVWGIFTTIWLPHLDTSKSYAGMMAAMAAALPAQHGCIASTHLAATPRALMAYYLSIVTVPNGQGECDLWVVQTGGASQVPQPGPNWHRIWDGSRVGDRHEHYWLYEKTATPD